MNKKQNYTSRAKIILGKKKLAPMNRTLVLTEDDVKRYNSFFTLSENTNVVNLDDVKNKVILDDCIKGMRKLPEKSIDLIFADPPYYNAGKDFGEGTVRLSKSEYIVWSEKWIKEAVRLLKDTGSIYVCCSWECSGLIQEILRKFLTIKNRITWKREKGRGAKRNWKENMEDIWFAVKNNKRYTFNIDTVKIKKEIIAPYRYGGKGGEPKGWVEEDSGRFRYTHPSNIWIDMVVPFWSMPENTPHPTQKPEKLVERIILASSNRGGIILDPFIGSGTTAIMARKNGRNFIGFEVNKNYIRLCLKRLDK